jgi:hypothetical protein
MINGGKTNFRSLHKTRGNGGGRLWLY